MFLNTIRFFGLFIFNYFLIISSNYIDTYQLLQDINMISNAQNTDVNTTFIIICFAVSLLTILLNLFFKPFIEIYLLHYSRYLFYLLISLISLSSVYIVFRVYGYSRFSIVIYIFFTAAFLMFSEKLSTFKLFSKKSRQD
jgi:magnesium-transporting ATPase (P-type)